MTATTPHQTATERGTTHPAAVTASEQQIRVEQIDPSVLVVEDNIRADASLSRSFLASVRQHGVIVPILAHPGDDGQIIVRDGQRRTLAARDAGLTAIPAYIVEAADETAVRIVQQLITNDHREALTDADRAEAWRHLALEGMSATKIARATGTKKATVEAGIAVASNDLGATALTDHDLTLEQALVLIEFEADPAAVSELRTVAKTDPGRFAHHAQRLRDEKTARELIAEMTAQYQADGVPVVDWPDYDDIDTAFLRDLATADGEPLTEANYAGKPGYAVCIRESWRGIDVSPVVVNWREHGLRKTSDTGRGPGPMTDEQKAERRELIANNKAWTSAEKVRRAWLATFLARKRLPIDALAFAATALATCGSEVGRAVTDQHETACSLLGENQPSYGQPHPLAKVIAANPAKATHVTVALGLGALEAATSKTTWRTPTQAATGYFQALTGWGYTPSHVEQIVLDAATPTAENPRTDDGSDED
jgi:ParB family chromosome partitioning protein